MVHPGSIVKKIIEDNNLVVSTVAKDILITRQQLHRVMSGDSDISLEMAIRFGKYFGNDADYWINLQLDYDFEIALENMQTAIDKIPTINVKV